MALLKAACLIDLGLSAFALSLCHGDDAGRPVDGDPISQAMGGESVPCDEQVCGDDGHALSKPNRS